MDSYPLVSVIVPNYNHEKYLPERLNSILNQTFQDFELILLDDCSTDGSREILKSFKKNSKVTHLEFSVSNSGSPFKQWAKGVNLASGDYIWIAESDDYCDKVFLQILIQKFLKDKDLKIAYSGLNWVDEHGAILRDLSVYNSSYSRNGNIELINTISLFNSIQNVSAVVFEKNTLLKFISKIENYKYCGDWILYAYILTTECKILFESQKLTSYRYYHNIDHNVIMLMVT
jgi:glycosyltransferase involved in cell wall biosynthesis